MNNVPTIKIGIIAGSTEWMPAEIVKNKIDRLVDAYDKKYGIENVHVSPIILSDNEVNIKRVRRDFDKAECDAMCVYWGNYGPESAATLLASEYNGPIMFFGAAEEGEFLCHEERADALSGFINACYALKLRKKNVYIPRRPVSTLSESVDTIHDFIAIARTFIAVKNLKVISFGPRPTSYLASLAPLHPLYDLGIDISEYSELELYNSFQRHADDGRISAVVSEMIEEVNAQDISDEKKEKLCLQAQFELTMSDWIRTHKGSRKYLTLTNTCWPAFPVDFGFVPCYVNSRLTGKGFPVACEVDVYGAVSEYIGQCISNNVVTILNINNNVPSDIYNGSICGNTFNDKTYKNSDLFVGYHCGVTCSSLLNKAELKEHYVNEKLIGEDKSYGTVQGNLRESDITIFRIQGTPDGRLVAYVAEGQILPVEALTYGGRCIIAIPEMERFIRNVIIECGFPNHTVVIYGHCSMELVSVLKMLKIEDIYYNHPQHIPYNSEDALSMI